ETAEDGVGEGVYATTGSSLPDCSHACGPCLPCKRVMVQLHGLPCVVTMDSKNHVFYSSISLEGESEREEG
ncbi:hypothetical protein B296_00043591, partial [Ensete ventricosum]